MNVRLSHGRMRSGRLRKISGTRKAYPQPLDPNSCLMRLKKGIRAIKTQPKEEKQTLEPGYAKQDNEASPRGKSPTAGRQDPGPNLETNSLSLCFPI